MNPDQYFKINDLWDLDKLKAHAEHHLVKVITSPRFPGIVMLHYSEDAQWDKAWNTFNRMCRGLIVHLPTQKVLAWPYSKFFNVGEMPETSYENLSSLGEFSTSEKLDGSMILVYQDPNTGEIHCTSKGSLDSEHGYYATSILPESVKKIELLNKYTLIFELISKKFQIVIDYSRKEGYPESLYLIGARDKVSGKLLTYAEVQKLATLLNLPTFKTYSFDSLDQLIETVRGLSILQEGFVLRFSEDLLVKVKGNAYLQMHRFISHLSDRNLLDAVANNKADELITLCPEEYKDDVKIKISYFEKRVVNLQEECYSKYIQAPKESRKEFAMWTNQNVEKYLKGFLFQLFDKKDLDRKHICKVIEEVEHINGQTKI